jgi:UDP-2,3-diacylglucosamine hydrolase
MRYLVISDVHAGDPRINNSDKLTRLLADAQYDAVILAGDIIDFWAESDTRVIAERYCSFFSMLRVVALTKRIIYILGNHDPVEYEGHIRRLVPQAEIRSSMIIDEFNNRRCLVLHGHQMESGMSAGVQYWLTLTLWKWTGIDLQKFFGNLFGLYAWHARRIQQRFVLTTGLGKFNRIVLGHTHIPMVGETNLIKYTNCGDWVRHNTYATITDGEVELHEWKI